MYERRFDTDWDSLGEDELLLRAYALGVDARFDNYHEEELERLQAVAKSNYDGSLIELAYSEGKREARELVDGDASPETAWTELVEGGEGVPRGDEATKGEDQDPAGVPGLPGALERIDPDGSPGDGLDPVRLPEFLRRE